MFYILSIYTPNLYGNLNSKEILVRRWEFKNSSHILLLVIIIIIFFYYCSVILWLQYLIKKGLETNLKKCQFWFRFVFGFGLKFNTGSKFLLPRFCFQFQFEHRPFWIEPTGVYVLHLETQNLRHRLYKLRRWCSDVPIWTIYKPMLNCSICGWSALKKYLYTDIATTCRVRTTTYYCYSTVGWRVRLKLWAYIGTL